MLRQEKIRLQGPGDEAELEEGLRHEEVEGGEREGADTYREGEKEAGTGTEEEGEGADAYGDGAVKEALRGGGDSGG